MNVITGEVAIEWHGFFQARKKLALGGPHERHVMIGSSHWE